jgi:acid phosphatase family membrane protein YuiD
MNDTPAGSLLGSACFWSAFLAWMMAQFCKLLTGLQRTHRVDFSYLVSIGGMPSAHSAMATALAAAIGLRSGFGSPLFALGLAFALVVMFDASTVRRAAGLQARLLNEIIDELFKEHHLSERKLAELLGHTRLEVFLGMIIGILVSLLVYAVERWLWPTG